ncbi:MAG: hypothetical protein JO141_03155 [Bradyrhizobium sp.]|nr:hypothetical protein [Bradyrhizobium sp.]
MTRLQQARSRTAAIDLHSYVSTTMFKAIAAAAVVSALLASTPVFAQAAIQELGAFAQAYPYLDVLNGGAPTPALKIYNDAAAMQAYVARELGTSQPHHTHH